ncbi:MAG: hypothetical protein A2942_03415 [Candidatus Lloydbacteria bacterium RIFCSPLOWO2_01_FULL_50_20]|uniref:Uncharacterized protein n=1 Tax=Candidatus Lloydbacteria bacterium RIFCSPLOWO2_01_FULL_50_20 TaxID=1798665 RepID=A0A1G2DDL3_9BACT|nr:MAG: hypothetical protein A3C13_03280 [Candidatus Lloydbacteria bacterium RIFCSPHIGHO2_02_FULL_50_11]OGZ11031.1 MAG: hypothetical protein A2942_03415 [Candidatus Lloydbacteria bacterium RIFCSPLOWO2_01_FULL_50_20]
MTEQVRVTKRDGVPVGYHDDGPPMESPFAKLAALKKWQEAVSIADPPAVESSPPESAEGVELDSEAGRERTAEEDRQLVEEMVALLPPSSLPDEAMKNDRGESGEKDEPGTSRFSLEVPEGVSCDIGELFRLLDVANVTLPKRYWFYSVHEGKCGTATLRVVRSKGELVVLVVAVQDDIPEYVRELRMSGAEMTLEVLVHPERLGTDEMSLKAKKFAKLLAAIHRRKVRARSRNRHRKGAAKHQQQDQQS